MKQRKPGLLICAAGIFLAALVFVTFSPLNCRAQEPGPPYPVIFQTDVFYTMEDIDDYIDTATILKSSEIDLKGIILDNHKYPEDGQRPLEKLMTLAGRKVPVVKGLGSEFGGFQLRSSEDKGLYIDGQEGVELILKTLRESDRKVSLISVASMTDFAVAYIRDPELFTRKVDTLYIIGGNALKHTSGYNSSLDPKAFVFLMGIKDIPIVWGTEDVSMWYFPAPQMLVPAKNALAHFILQELLYWWLRNDWRAGLHKDRYLYYDLGHLMWCTPAFVLASHDPHAAEMFDLVPTKVEFDDQGGMKNIQLGVANSNIRLITNVNGDKLNEFIVSRINR